MENCSRAANDFDRLEYPFGSAGDFNEEADLEDLADFVDFDESESLEAILESGSETGTGGIVFELADWDDDDFCTTGRFCLSKYMVAAVSVIAISSARTSLAMLWG